MVLLQGGDGIEEDWRRGREGVENQVQVRSMTDPTLGGRN